MDYKNGPSKINNTLLVLYCVLVFAMLCAPLALIGVFPGGAVTEIARVDAEVDTAQGADVPVAADDSSFIPNPLMPFGDNFERSFGLRSELISLDAAVHSSLFRESSNRRVTVGQGGWLFLSETVDPYAQANSYSENLLRRVSRTVSLINEYLDANGIGFLVAIAPNKSSVYPEHLPYYAKPPLDNEDKLLTRLHSSLAAMGISYVDLSGHLMNAKSQKDSLASPGVTNKDYVFIPPKADIYHKLDTHWNNLGAYLAYTEIINAIADASNMKNLNLPHVTPMSIFPEERTDFPGDLDRMLSPESERFDIQYYLPVERAFRSQKPLVNLEEMEIVTTSDINDVRLLMFRDSFANALIPFVSNSVGEAAYLRALPYPVSRAVSREYDVVVMEIVERNIPMIVQAAPVMPAPAREISLADTQVFDNADGITVAYAEISIAGQLDKICGFFDPAMRNNADGATVYAILTPSHTGGNPADPTDGGNPADPFIFEAFPILDPSVRELAEEKFREAAEDCGFTLYVDGFEIPEGRYELQILVSPADSAALGQSMTSPIAVYNNPME